VTGPQDVRAAMGWPSRHPALDVTCPHCRAPAGERCTGLTGNRKRDAPHVARVAAVEPPSGPDGPLPAV
jgi:hypothetical protein